MYVCVSIYICVYVRAHMHVCLGTCDGTHTLLCAHTRVYGHARTWHVCLHTCLCARTCVHVCIAAYVRACTCTSVHTCVHIYTVFAYVYISVSVCATRLRRERTGSHTWEAHPAVTPQASLPRGAPALTSPRPVIVPRVSFLAPSPPRGLGSPCPGLALIPRSSEWAACLSSWLLRQHALA